MKRFWSCAFFVLQSSLVRGLHFSTPPTATAGQSFTATWFGPPHTQFAIRIPSGSNGKLDDHDFVTTVSLSSGERSDTVALLAPATAGTFSVVAYEGPKLSRVGGSSPIKVVAAEDNVGEQSPDSEDTSSSGDESSTAISQKSISWSSTSTQLPGGTITTVTTTTAPYVSEASSVSDSQASVPLVVASQLNNSASVTRPTSTSQTNGNGTQGPPASSDGSKSNNLVLVLLAVIIGIIILTILLFLYRRHRKRKEISDENSDWASCMEYSNKYNKRSSKYSSWNGSSIGPSDSISQAHVPSSRPFIPTTLVSTEYSEGHDSTTLLSDEKGYQKGDYKGSGIESESDYTYLPVLTRT
ncbi:hypothetical protein VKT23_007751 [Stygiomarasmius scandens]|uniref:Uncharacterized protein n=1 Tax=Marasmiellus scandens TaxID=2682957 RepID=A0ABR1JL13_9AGAR